MGVRSVLLTAIGLLAPLSPVAAQPVVAIQANGRPPFDGGKARLAVTMTSSGGVSKGAYQAGLDWAVVQLLRHRREYAGGATPTFSVESFSGASAGNINAVLNSLLWCTAFRKLDLARESSDASLHWAIWVNTGFPQLFPKRGKRGEAGLLDRRFFETNHAQRLGDYLRTAPAQKGCTTSVGIALTRVQPERVRTADGVETRIQRFASVYALSERNDSLVLGPFVSAAPTPTDELRRESVRSLGALAMLPALGDPHASNDDRLKQIFEVSIASSSYPVAFAPKSIPYIPGGLATQLHPAEVERAEFADGGIFDNNPLALAQRLLELRHKPATPNAPVIAVFANPYNLRGDLANSRKATLTARPREGLGGAVQLLSGAFSSAQDYEVQSYLRLIARDVEDLRDTSSAWRPRTATATRSMPIVGEQLRSFAAFTGRLFREHDFYAGVYDGLYHAARTFSCHDTSAATPTSDTTTLKLERCVAEAMDSLVHKNPLQLDVTAQAVVGWYFSGRVADSVFANSPKDRSLNRVRLRAHAAVFEAMRAARSAPTEAECADGSFLSRQLCAGGGRWLVEALSRDSRFMRDARALCAICNRRENRPARDAGECTVDGDLLGYLEDPDAYLGELGDRLILRLVQIEEDQPSRIPRADDEQWAAELLAMLYRSSNYRDRRGVEVNPGSWAFDFSRPQASVMSIAGMLLPNTVQFGRGQRASDPAGTNLGRTQWANPVYGWRPLVWHTRLVDWGISYEATRFRVPKDDGAWDARWDQRIGFAATSHRLHLPKFSSTTLQVLRAQSLFDREGRARPGPLLELSTRFAFDKVSMGMRMVPQRGAQFFVGVSDIGGIAYWWIR